MAEQFQFFMDKATIDFSQNLDQHLADLFRERNLTVAVAESVTGGLLSKMLTSIPGSSQYFMGGAVCYSPRAKIVQTGIDPKIIAKHGLVSEETALGLARGIRQRLRAAIGIGLTGAAGPESHGGRPAGTVFIALVDKDKELVKEYDFEGGREEIQNKAVQAALSMLWMNYKTNE